MPKTYWSLGTAERLIWVSLDYLVGEGVNSKFDKSTVKRIEEIQQLEEEKKKTLFDVIDTFIRESKGRKAFAH